MWRAVERRAATLYRFAVDNGEAKSEDPAVELALARAGGGQPLSAAVRSKMELKLSISLERVRIHTDSVAADAARAVRAKAFTVGEDIFFADGAYAPETPAGEKLLAHELTHVLQAHQGRIVNGGAGIQISNPNASLEREADEVAEQIDNRELTHRDATKPERRSPHPDSPQAVLVELGPGNAMENSHASRFSAAMDDNFGDVRIHTDSAAAQKAAALGARAFTIGSHVAFAAGEYRPGTPEGDALIAHELAHVQQQRGAAQAPRRRKREDEPLPDGTHEADADRAAAGVLARLYGVGAGLTRAARRIAGAMSDRTRATTTSGFSLQRCPNGGGEPPLERRVQCSSDASGTSRPAVLTQSQFLAATRGARIDIAAIRSDPALAGSGLEAADRNRDGSIAGEDEWRAVFQRLSGQRSSLPLRAGGRPTSAGAMLAALARLSGHTALAQAVGPMSLEHAITILGMSDTAIDEGNQLRQRTPVQVITDVAPGERGDMVRGSDGRPLDLMQDAQLDSFVRSLPLPIEVQRAVRQVLGTVSRGGRRELAELARIWAEAYCGRAIPRRLVISGHGDGVWISGNDPDYIRRDWVLALAEAMPNAAQQIYAIHLGSCQHGWEPRLEAWRRAFPNVQNIWGYAGTSPSGGAAYSHQRTWEQGTHDLPPGGGAVRADAAHGTRRGDVVTVWTRDGGFSGPRLRPLDELRTEAMAGLPQFEAVLAGTGDIGAPHNGFGNTYYQLLQQLTNYPEAEQSWTLRREQILRMRFYNEGVRMQFQRAHSSQISTAYQALHLPVPDFSRLTRADAMAEISRFESARGGGSTNATVEALWPELQGLRTLDPAHIPFSWVTVH